MQIEAHLGHCSFEKQIRISLSRWAEDTYLQHPQARIAAAAQATDIDVYPVDVTRADRDRHGRRCAAPGLVRREHAAGAVNAVMVVPVLIVIETVLDAARGPAREHATPPELKRPEGAFDLAVQIRRPHATAYVVDVQAAFELGTEPFPELAAVVGDEELGLAIFSDSSANEAQRVARSW